MKKNVLLVIGFFLFTSLFAQDIILKKNVDEKQTVGFKRYFVFDSTRTYLLKYNPPFDYDTTKYYRPMLVNIWYPSEKGKGKTFQYKDYLNFSSTNESFKIFTERLAHFNIQTIKNNAFRNTLLNDTIIENNFLDSLLSIDTHVYQNAVPLNSKHPLIVYNQSLGGTIEENSVLFQYLASNGYVVINCAYQSEAGKIMHPDWDLLRSEMDVDFLIRFTDTLDYVDNTNLHFIGYSFGAQSNFNILTKNHNVRSAISFDSRFEYFLDYNPDGYNELPQYLLKNTKKITAPLLLFTNQDAVYLIIDSLKYTDRDYVFVKDYEHSDFNSATELRNLLLSRNNYNNDLAVKWKSYLNINKMVLDFINFHSSASTNFNKFELLNYDKEQFYIEKMNKGISKPLQRKDTIYTPRQILFSIEKYGIDTARHLCNIQKINFSEDAFNQYAYYLINKQLYGLAENVLLWSIELYSKNSNLYDSLGELYFIEKKYQKSIQSYQISLELNPKNKNAEQYIDKIQKTMKK